MGAVLCSQINYNSHRSVTELAGLYLNWLASSTNLLLPSLAHPIQVIITGHKFLVSSNSLMSNLKMHSYTGTFICSVN